MKYTCSKRSKCPKVPVNDSICLNRYQKHLGYFLLQLLQKKTPQPPSGGVFVFGDKCHLQRFQAVPHSNSPLTYEVRRVWRAGNALHQAHVIDEPGRRAGPIWLQHRKPTRTALAPGASGRWHFGETATAYLLPTSHLPTHSPHHAAYCVR